MYRTCCVSSCTSKQDTVLMHKIPRSSDRQRVWLDIIDNRKLDNLRHSQYCCLKVCEKHFERRFKNRLRLRFGAYPTLFTPEEISKGVPERTNYGDTCLSDHRYKKDKVHNDHSYVKIGVSEMRGTKCSSVPGGIVSHEVTVADGVHNNTREEGPEKADELAPDNAPKEATEVAPDIAPKNPDPTDPESRESLNAVFSWETEELVIAADDTDVLQSHPEVSARAVLEQDLTETSLYQDDDPFVSDDYSGYDHNYGCNECGGNILRFRYTCVQCADWDLCDACEARAAHAAHYVLRIPSQRPYKEIQAVLATIRQHLLSENPFEPERAHSVKSEPEELQETQELQEPQETQEPQEPQEPPPTEPPPEGDWEVEFLDSSDIEEVPEVLEVGAPPPAKRAAAPRRAPLNTTIPDCSEPILKRLPKQIKRPKIVDETSEVPPTRSRSEDKLHPHRTETSPETASTAPTAIPNIESAKNILVRIPAGFDPVGVVEMLNSQVSVRLKPIEESSATVKTDN